MYWDNSCITLHIAITYSYLFIYDYFNQCCYCVTFTDSNNPLGSDPVIQNDSKLTHTASAVSTSYSKTVYMWITSKLANSNYNNSY